MAVDIKMLFRRKPTPPNASKSSTDTSSLPRPSFVHESTTSDVTDRKSIDTRYKDSTDTIRPQTTVPIGPDTCSAPLPVTSSKLIRPVFLRQVSEPTVGRTSISDWVASQRILNPLVESPEASLPEGHDGCVELRTVRGESLSLFPRPIPRRTKSFPRPASRVSTTGSVSSTFSAVPERLADGLRTSTRRLKHSASKLSLVSILDDEDEDEDDKSRKLKGPCRVHAPKPCRCQTSLTCTISDPLRFRHVTHALPQEFKDIATRTESDLVADFSAVRASQLALEDLRGIKATGIAHVRNCSDEETSSSICSAVPSLMSSNSYESLQASRPASQVSDNGTFASYSTTLSRQSSIFKPTTKASFSRPFVNGRPPRFDSLRSVRHYEPSIHSFSAPFYRTQPGSATTTPSHSVPTTPVEELLSELEYWTSRLEPKNPPLSEEEIHIFAELPDDPSAGRAKIYPVTRTAHQISSMTSQAMPPVTIQTIVIATDRDDETPQTSKEELLIRAATSFVDMRTSMMRSSVTNGMCTSWSCQGE